MVCSGFAPTFSYEVFDSGAANSGGCNTLPSAQQVSSELAGLRQPGATKAAVSSSMVCLHPAAVTFSCVRSMSCLLSSQQSEYTPTCVCHLEANYQSPRISITVPPSQAPPVWRLRGLAGSFAKPSTCCSS